MFVIISIISILVVVFIIKGYWYCIYYMKMDKMFKKGYLIVSVLKESVVNIGDSLTVFQVFVSCWYDIVLDIDEIFYLDGNYNGLMKINVVVISLYYFV